MEMLAFAVCLALGQEAAPAPAAEPVVELEGAEAPAPAQEPPKIVPPPAEPPPRPLVERPEPGPSAGAFVVWTGVVLALLAGALVLLRRFGRGGRFLGGASLIEILARRSLGPRQDLFLVEVGPKIFLVGATRDRLAPLGEFSNPDDVALLRANAPGRREESVRSAFKESLREGLREEAAPRAPESAYATIADEIAEIRKTVRAWKA